MTNIDQHHPAVRPVLQFPACLICNSERSIPFLEVPNRFNLSEKFQLVSCQECSFVFLKPRPDSASISTYYEDQQYQPHQDQARSLSEKLYRFVRVWNNGYKRRLIEKLVPSGNVFDYGCGTGEFLLEMKNHGWITRGFEPSAKAAEIARNYGLEVETAQKNFPRNMDVVTLWHVLEHVHEARELLTELKESLSPGGYLIIAVPNRNCYDAGIFRENWAAYDAPRHLYHFTPRDMQSLLHSLQIEIVLQKRLYFDPWYNSLLSAQLEVKTRISSGFIFRILKILWAAKISTIQSFVNKKNSSSIVYIAKPVKS